MIRPTFSRGANTAERGPITVRMWPFRARHQFDKRSPPDIPECITPTSSPSTALARCTNRGVKPISGTSRRALRPHSIVRLAARRYTSVLPLPVTPCNNRLRNPSPRSRIRSSACCWLSIRQNRPAPSSPPDHLLCSSASNGSRRISMSPLTKSDLIVATPQPAASQRASTLIPSVLSQSTSIMRRCAGALSVCSRALARVIWRIGMATSCQRPPTPEDHSSSM